jgi:porphobilinogen synthase
MAGLTLRRLRANAHVRDLVRAVRLAPGQFLQPLFAVEGLREREPVPGIHDTFRDTPDSLARQVEADLAAGIRRFLLFAVPRAKHAAGFHYGFGASVVADLRRRFGSDIFLAADVCLCSHTTHGHCGLLDGDGSRVLNAESVAELARQAVAWAAAGVDCVAPSDMLDGRVGAIRAALDTAGHDATVLMSYAAKFHSGFYGPFRVAADSAPVAGLRDRASYQLDPARRDDALAAARRDAAEGADILMVKPGLPYLDVLAALSAELPLPFAAYQTSGEQAALDLLTREGLADGDRVQRETWTALARAGARIIISYAARRAPRLLADD